MVEIVGTFSVTHVNDCDTDNGTRQAIDNSRAGVILLWFREVRRDVSLIFLC